MSLRFYICLQKIPAGYFQKHKSFIICVVKLRMTGNDRSIFCQSEVLDINLIRIGQWRWRSTWEKNLSAFLMPHKIQRYGQGGNEKMSESKQTRRDVIDAQLQKTKAELATAKHWEAKLRNQIKGMTEKERRYRNIVWGSHFEYLLREKLNVWKEQLAMFDDDRVKDILWIRCLLTSNLTTMFTDVNY